MKTLRHRAVEILYEEWAKAGGEPVRGEAVSRRLLDEGYEVPYGELDELWELLSYEDQIRGPSGVRGEITWVNPDIMEVTLGVEEGPGF